MTLDLFTDFAGTLVPTNLRDSLETPSRTLDSTVRGQMGVQETSTNLPVPVLAEPNSKAVLANGFRSEHSRQARESTGYDAGAVMNCGHSRGGQNSFDGETYVPELDRTRLKAQLVRVRELMRDGRKRSLAEIAAVTGDPESSVGARLRDLRKAKFGMWTVTKTRRSQGTWEYWLGAKGL